MEELIFYYKNTKKSLRVSSSDNEGDIEIKIEDTFNYEAFYLNKSQTQQLIIFLQNEMDKSK